MLEAFPLLMPIEGHWKRANPFSIRRLGFARSEVPYLPMDVRDEIIPTETTVPRDFSPPTLVQRLAARERPNRTAVGRQRWNHLLFAHWKIPAAAVQATLPKGLYVDTFEGEAYVGIVPFYMQRIRPKGLPALPWISWFLELNVRTYVHDATGVPGVWFYSLDCNQPLAVTIARTFFHLPYFHARMSARLRDEWIYYECERRGENCYTARYEWKPGKIGRTAQPGSLEFFLVERYVLFSCTRRGHIYTGRVHHTPYLITEPEVTQFSTQPALQAGFMLNEKPDSLLGALAVDVSVFSLV